MLYVFVVDDFFLHKVNEKIHDQNQLVFAITDGEDGERFPGNKCWVI
jgi:hypothetical protein